MLPRHASHFERGPLSFISAGGLDVDEHVLEEVQVVDGGEGFFGAFGVGEVGFGVGGGDDGEVAAEGGFNFLVEVVAWAGGLVGWRGWKSEEREGLKEGGRKKSQNCRGEKLHRRTR